MTKRKTNNHNIFSVIRRSVLIFLFAVGALNGTAQNVKIEAILSANDTIVIGDQFHYQLKVYKPKGMKLDFPIPEKELTKGIEVIEPGDIDSLDYGKGVTELTQTYLLTSFDSGYYMIPRQKFAVHTATGVDTFLSNPVYLDVFTIKVDTANAIFDIKMPYEAPISFREVLPFLLIALLVILLAFAGWYIYKKRKNNEPILRRVKPKEPAHIIAFRELEHLKEERLWQQDRVKLYYTKLTDVIRNYLWNRYDVKTLERTSEEILESLISIEIEDSNYRKLRDLFYTSDLAKFAKYKPIADENIKSYNEAFEFVTKTKKEEEIVTNEEVEVVENKPETEGGEEKEIAESLNKEEDESHV